MTSHKLADRAAWDAAVLDARRLVARSQKCSAYQFCDGFDNYSSPSTLYETVNGSPTISTSYRRFAPPSGCPGQGIAFGGNTWVRKNLLSNQPTLIIKVAYNFPTLGVTSGGAPFLQLLDSGTAQCSICVHPSGALSIYRGSGTFTGILLAITGPGVIKASAYQAFEFVVSIGASGSFTAWVNGLEVLAATGINTQSTGDAFANQVGLGDLGNGLNQTTNADDFRIWDATGTTQNVALGVTLQDSRLITKLPSAAGAYSQLTPNGASANWQCVDDNPPDGDTTYVSGSTAGLMDAYDVPSAGFTAAPVMVAARAYARKDDAGTRQLAVGVDSSGHTSVGPTYALGSTYAWVDGCIPDDPNTSSVWTAVGADDAQILVEEIA